MTIYYEEGSGEKGKMKKEETNEELSLSKQRKIAKKKELAKKKKQAILTKVIVVLLALAAVGLIVFFIVKDQIKKSKQVTMDTDYSALIEENGMIKNVKAKDYITLADYNNITVDRSEIEYPDEKVDSDIDSLLENNKALSTAEDIVAKDGDKVSIDYVGRIDGVEFEGGSANGYELSLGSGTFIDNFEEQVEGHKPGESFDVTATFPDNYTNNPSLAGKTAVFAVKLNGIYVKPEFTDEFVKEHLSENASTVEEYRQYLKDTNYEKNLTKYVRDYVVNNSTIKSTPADYLKKLKGNYKAMEYSNFQYMNQFYQSYTGSTRYTSFEDYLSQTYSQNEEQYDEGLEEKVTEDMKFSLFCQAVAETEGITTNYDETREYFLSEGGTEEDFDAQIAAYGKAYVVQMYLDTKVIKSLCERTTVK